MSTRDDSLLHCFALFVEVSLPKKVRGVFEWARARQMTSKRKKEKDSKKRKNKGWGIFIYKARVGFGAWYWEK
jgi:hypothetical protein